MKAIVLGTCRVPSFTQTMVITIQPEEQEAFKLMVTRAINTWQEAPPSVRRLHDWLQGRISQQEVLMEVIPSEMRTTQLCSNCAAPAHMHPWRNCDEFQP
jgi:hypothetical protein